MSDIILTQAFDSETPLSEDIIKNTLAMVLSKQFDKFKFHTRKPQQFSCRVKTKLLNPIVSLKGSLQIKIQGNKAKLMIDASTKTNGWFWFTILISFFCWPLFLLDFWMYYSQKKRSIEAFNQTFKQIEFELGKI